MPIGEFTRAFYAMNKVLEDASYSVGLSKRAAVVLLILYETQGGGMRTDELVKRFQTWYVSTANTAAKDVSIAKGELFRDDLVVARRGIRNVEMTDGGRERAVKLAAGIEQFLKGLVDDADQSSVLNKVLESIPMPKKPVDSERIARIAKDGKPGRNR